MSSYFLGDTIFSTPRIDYSRTLIRPNRCPRLACCTVLHALPLTSQPEPYTTHSLKSETRSRSLSSLWSPSNSPGHIYRSCTRPCTVGPLGPPATGPCAISTSPSIAVRSAGAHCGASQAPAYPPGPPLPAPPPALSSAWAPPLLAPPSAGAPCIGCGAAASPANLFFRGSPASLSSRRVDPERPKWK